MTARIRLASEGDAAAIRRIYAPIVENTAISFKTVPPTESEVAERIASTLELPVARLRRRRGRRLRLRRGVRE